MRVEEGMSRGEEQVQHAHHRGSGAGRYLAWTLLALLAAALACAAPPGGEDNDGEDAGTDAGHEGVLVLVTYSGVEEEVDLTTLDTVDVEGEDLVLLSSVVLEAFPTRALADILANFEAYDGFVPSQSPYCDGLVPVFGLRLEQGYIDPATRNVSWDEALQFPGCMYVDECVEIEIFDQ